MTTTLALPAIIQRADNLPSPPGIAVELLRLTENEDVTIDDLVATLSSDPALAAKILKVSNSALFRVGKEVMTLNRACMVLGLKTVRLMSLSFALTSALGGERKGGFDYKQYWKRSLVRASSARALAARRQRNMSDEAFLAGLLSRIGQLVLAECASAEYAQVIEAAKGSWPSADLERSLLGCDSDEVGLALLESWGMPMLTRAIIASIRRNPDETDHSVARLAPIMQFAALCEELICGDDKTSALDALRHKAGSVGLGGEALDEFLLEVEKEVLHTAEFFDVKLGNSLDMTLILQQAQVRLLHATLSTAVQAHRAEERASDLESSNQQWRTKAQTDRLTGIANRACFDEALAQCLDRRMAGHVPGVLGLLMIDVDRFKRFNDTYGHLTGDEVLKVVAKSMESVCRESELTARYGGEEFCVLMPSAKPAGIKALAERVREKIEQTAVEVAGKTLRVTASVGGASVGNVSSQADGQALIREADARLYQAKQNGRNRICSFDNYS